MRRFLFSAVLFALCGFVQTAEAQQTFVPGTGDAWYGYTGTIMLTREDPRNVQLGVGAGNADLGFNASRFDFGPKFGYETVVGRRFDDGNGFEGRFFDVNLGTGSPNFTGGGNTIFTPFITPNGVTGPTPVTAAAGYVSSLKNLELNYRGQVTQAIGLISGFRYIDLGEELQLTYTNLSGAINSQQIRSKNEMWGGQLGLDALLYSGDRLSLSTFGKTGIFYNEASNSVYKNFRSGATNTINSARGSDDEFSYMFESGLNANVQMTRRLSFQAGYNIMWINGVALASDQIAVSNPTGGGTAQGVNPTQTSQVDTTSLFLHGMTLGLTYAW